MFYIVDKLLDSKSVFYRPPESMVFIFIRTRWTSGSHFWYFYETLHGDRTNVGLFEISTFCKCKIDIFVSIYLILRIYTYNKKGHNIPLTRRTLSLPFWDFDETLRGDRLNSQTEHLKIL